MSASKLYQTVSASGPRARLKPRSRKISQISSIAWVIGCSPPFHGPRDGSVRSSLDVEGPLCQGRHTCLQSIPDHALHPVGFLPYRGPLLGGHLTRARARIAEMRPSLRPRIGRRVPLEARIGILTPRRRLPAPRLRVPSAAGIDRSWVGRRSLQVCLMRRERALRPCPGPSERGYSAGLRGQPLFGAIDDRYRTPRDCARRGRPAPCGRARCRPPSAR